ncbi:MAG: oligogalacturonate-specific porin KdgM [Bacteroidetes bacterium HLUCCA01]|nr:MAG: oligogalacturonate-specific porin KdgM [Bacteroidetes bacterium HLUCCA01]
MKLYTIVFSLLFLATLPVSSQSVVSNKPEIFGSFRPVYYVTETRDRSGDYNTNYTINARFQLNVRYALRDDLQFRARLSSRLSNTQDELSFPIQSYTGSSGSYPAGTTTFDIIQLQWDVNPTIRITAGRFQGRYALAGFIPKGMDRYYSANLSISHTDGIWVRWNMNRNWRLDGIISYNPDEGSSHAARAPLTFTEPTSHITTFANLAHRNTTGLWVQRELSVSVYPQSFQRDGSWHNLSIFTARAMLRLPIHASTGEYWAGGELGFIPDAPDPVDAGIPVAEPFSATSSIAWQVSAYANNLFDRHTLGILYGQTEPNWVISSSYRPNNTMSEIRYRYTFTSWLNFEIRYRLRTDLYRRTGSAFTQRDSDYYMRFNFRF